MVLVDGSPFLAGGLSQPSLLLLSAASVVTLVSVLSMCVCCKKKVKHGDDEADDVAYGVIVSDNTRGNSVLFRQGQGTIAERHSQPASKQTSVQNGNSRSSAPVVGAGTRRALPQLPESQLYTAINKTTPKDLRFADEPAPMYECIDPENDSVVDPLYSKVDPRSARKYDYPVFPGADQRKQQNKNNDVFYQSASMIYAGGSEDPYSSIASEPRVALASVDDDDTSAYDPGYAKVKSDKDAADKEQTDLELDKLYSKIRRGSSRRDQDSPIPGPSTVELVEPVGEVSRDMVNAHTNNQSDAGSSREPSYRYITVRESADVVRERLRQQGQLGPPVREHYYSTIGNEYESVGDGSTTYSRETESNNRTRTRPADDRLSINISPQEYVPPPPTSPIPDWTPGTSADVGHQPHSTTFPAVYASVSKPRPALAGPSPTIPTVVRPPARTRSISEHEPARTTGRVVRPSVLSYSTSHPGPEQTTPDASSSLQGIHDFMNRSILPYPDNLMNRRVTEEREVITERRQSSGPSADLIASTGSIGRSGSSGPAERVHNVPIRRLDLDSQEVSTSRVNDTSVERRSTDKHFIVSDSSLTRMEDSDERDKQTTIIHEDNQTTIKSKNSATSSSSNTISNPNLSTVYSSNISLADLEDWDDVDMEESDESSIAKVHIRVERKETELTDIGEEHHDEQLNTNTVSENKTMEKENKPYPPAASTSERNSKEIMIIIEDCDAHVEKAEDNQCTELNDHQDETEFLEQTASMASDVSKSLYDERIIDKNVKRTVEAVDSNVDENTSHEETVVTKHAAVYIPRGTDGASDNTAQPSGTPIPTGEEETWGDRHETNSISNSKNLDKQQQQQYHHESTDIQTQESEHEPISYEEPSQQIYPSNDLASEDCQPQILIVRGDHSIQPDEVYNDQCATEAIDPSCLSEIRKNTNNEFTEAASPKSAAEEISTVEDVPADDDDLNPNTAMTSKSKVVIDFRTTEEISETTHSKKLKHENPSKEERKTDEAKLAGPPGERREQTVKTCSVTSLTSIEEAELQIDEIARVHRRLNSTQRGSINSELEFIMLESDLETVDLDEKPNNEETVNMTDSAFADSAYYSMDRSRPENDMTWKELGFTINTVNEETDNKITQEQLRRGSLPDIVEQTEDDVESRMSKTTGPESTGSFEDETDSTKSPPDKSKADATRSLFEEPISYNHNRNEKLRKKNMQMSDDNPFAFSQGKLVRDPHTIPAGHTDHPEYENVKHSSAWKENITDKDTKQTTDMHGSGSYGNSADSLNVLDNGSVSLDSLNSTNREEDDVLYMNTSADSLDVEYPTIVRRSRSPSKKRARIDSFTKSGELEDIGEGGSCPTSVRPESVEFSMQRRNKTRTKRLCNSPQSTSGTRKQNSLPGPSSPYDETQQITDGSITERSRRSGVPVLKQGAELRNMTDRSRARRQESVDREETEKEREHQRAMSRERRRKEKIEEERRRERLGTIYTANDYVSPVGMSSERGWPLVDRSSPPTLNYPAPGGAASTASDTGGAAAENNTDVSSFTQPLLTWDLSSDSDSDCGASPCVLGECFCHSASPRTIVSRSNVQCMHEIHWGEVSPDVFPPIKVSCAPQVAVPKPMWPSPY